MDDAQVAEMAQQWQKQLVKRFEELQLRQWCVKQSRPDLEPERILKFITEPFADTFKPSAD